MNFKKMTFLCMQRLTNFPYIEEDFDALTNYELLCKVVEYLNKVIANENNQNDAINELAEAFNTLKNYVDNYFKNLDVQDEINNKLDEMAESGQLTDIIAQYLGLAGMITFNNVAEMKQATNLVNGSKCCTLGYYEPNDGGASTYYITNTASETDFQEELSNGLYATLIEKENYIIPEQYGVYGDGIHDDTEKLQSLINKNKLLVLNKNYKISTTLSVDIAYHKGIKGNGKILINSSSSNNIAGIRTYSSLYEGSANTYNSNRFFIEGILITSLSETETVSDTHYGKGILLDTGSCRFSLIGCEIRNLQHGLYAPNTSDGIFNIKIERCVFAINDYNIYLTPVITDSGENIRINNSSISSSKTCNLYIGKDVFVNINLTSMDYPLNLQIRQDEGSTVNISNSHLEWQTDNPAFSLVSKCFLNITNSNIIYKVLTSSSYLFNCNNSNQAYVNFENCTFLCSNNYTNLSSTSGAYFKFSDCQRNETQPRESGFLTPYLVKNYSSGFNYNFPLGYNSGLTRTSTGCKVTVSSLTNNNVMLIPLDFNNKSGKINLTFKCSSSKTIPVKIADTLFIGDGHQTDIHAETENVDVTANTNYNFSKYYDRFKGMGMQLYVQFNLNSLEVGDTFELISSSTQVL